MKTTKSFNGLKLPYAEEKVREVTYDLLGESFTIIVKGDTKITTEFLIQEFLSDVYCIKFFNEPKELIFYTASQNNGYLQVYASVNLNRFDNDERDAILHFIKKNKIEEGNEYKNYDKIAALIQACQIAIFIKNSKCMCRMKKDLMSITKPEVRA